MFRLKWARVTAEKLPWATLDVQISCNSPRGRKIKDGEQRGLVIFDTCRMESWRADSLSRERSQGWKIGVRVGDRGRRRRVAGRVEGRIPLGSYVCRETAATADHLLQLRLLRVGHPLRARCSPHFHLGRLPTKIHARHLHTSLTKNTRAIHFSRRLTMMEGWFRGRLSAQRRRGNSLSGITVESGVQRFKLSFAAW